MSALIGKYKIYPRGFLGARREPILVKEPRKTGNPVYDVMLIGSEDEKSIVANLALEQAYQSVVRNDLNARKFDFKEQVLQQFMAAFGTSNFGEWYVAQFQSPSFGQMHQDFLDDTMNFLHGKKRRMSIQNWEEILDESENRLPRVSISDTASKFFGKRSAVEVTASAMMVYDVVYLWMKKEGGFTDMLTTGHILFGVKD